MIPLHPPLSLPLLLPPSLSLFSPQEWSWRPPWAVWILLPLRQLPHHLWVQTVWKKVSTAEIFSSCVLLATFLLPLSFPPSPSSLFLPLFSSILQVLSLAHDQAWSVLSHGRTQKGTALPDQLHQKGGCGLRWRYLHVCSQMSAQNDTRGMMVCFPLSDPWLIITSSLSSSSPSLPSFSLPSSRAPLSTSGPVTTLVSQTPWLDDPSSPSESHTSPREPRETSCKEISMCNGEGVWLLGA